MKVARFHQHGGPDVLRYEDAPDPASAPGRTVVRVRACGVNHLDLWQRRGIPRVSIPLPHISGSDVAGEVVDGGGTIQPSTRVLLQPGLSCGTCAMCSTGRDNLCGRYDLIGYLSDGGYAEFVSVPTENLVPIPDHIDFVDAAAFPVTFLTAWHMLVTRGGLQAGDTVLVIAAGSGVGQAAIQVARVLGARVFATAAAGKLEKARELGVEEAFDHYSGDYSRELKARTGGRGADIVIEHVGEATWDRSVRSLARGGRLVTCGATTGPAGSIDLRHLFARQLSLLGSYMGAKGELLRVAELFFRGRVRPVIDRVLPLSEAGHAHELVERADQFGKIILVPQEPQRGRFRPTYS